MARRSNFIEGNDNFREQNLRFVRNEFEDNINQFFGGANPGGGNSQQKPPPRDSLIVQPTPEGALPVPSEPGRILELDIRRQFIRELGASRVTAHALAVRTFKVKDFNLRYFQRQRFQLSVELGDSRQKVVDAEVLRAIMEAVENKEPDLESLPRTPSPPRNIDWHNVNPDNDRSRPRNRQGGGGDFRATRDNSRGFVEHQGRNAGPKNDPNNRYVRNPNNNDNRNANRDEFNRNNRNQNFDEFNSNNRNANPQVINPNNRNPNLQEINRNNRNANNQEFDHYNRNSDEFNRNNRITNPQQGRNANPQMEFNQNIRNENPAIIRNNRTVNPQTPNRNPNRQESYRNNRTTSNDNFNRNVNLQEINRNNRYVGPQDFNRNINPNPQEFNRNPQEFNRNPQELNRNPRELNRNPQELNRNMNPQRNRDLPMSSREVHGPQINPRGMPPNFNNSQGNPNVRALPLNSREMLQNLNNNKNQGPRQGPGVNDFMPYEEDDIDGTPIIDQRQDIDDHFLESRERQQPNPHSDFRQMQHGGPPQIGHNYQRIVNNNQITICRQDWIDANIRELELITRPNNPNLNDNIRSQRSRQFEDQDQGYNIMEDDERIRRQQQEDDFRRPGFRGPEDPGFRNNSERSFESNQGNIIVQRNTDPNYLGRGRNERRHFNNDNYENDRTQSNDSVTFRGSNNPDVSPKRYRRGSSSEDRYQRDRHPQAPVNPNQNRSNQGRNAPNPRHITTSQDRTMARKSNSSSGNPRSTSKATQERNPGRNTNQDRNPRSTSLASQSRSTSGGEKHGKDRSLTRSVKPGDANLKKPMSSGPKNQAGVTQNSRVSTQTKSNRSTSEANSSTAKASTSNQARNNEDWEKARAAAGQKRKAETKDSESSRPPKVDNKRKRMTASQPAFIISGIRLPYINNHRKKLPQSEDDSYAVTFFEQTPIYNTNIYAIDDDQVDDADEVESDAESIDSYLSGSKGKNCYSKKLIRNKLNREWMAVYRENNYKDWYAWWKDYKWCGTEITKQLDKLGDRKMRHRFMPKLCLTTDILIREIFKWGNKGLAKNTFSHYRNMRSIYQLMNETFLKALSEEQQEKLQDLIRHIPNHLWLYKIRSMVYLWERYHRILKNLDETKIHKENELRAIAREWKDPLFHWLAKQAFDELKAISGVAWPKHRELYHGL